MDDIEGGGRGHSRRRTVEEGVALDRMRHLWAPRSSGHGQQTTGEAQGRGLCNSGV